MKQSLHPVHEPGAQVALLLCSSQAAPCQGQETPEEGHIWQSFPMKRKAAAGQERLKTGREKLARDRIVSNPNMDQLKSGIES